MTDLPPCTLGDGPADFLWLNFCGGKPPEIDGEGPVKDGFFPLKNEMKWL
jgi:hypothetical protein